MLPSNPAVSLVQNFLRNQTGVIEVSRPAPDQLLLTVGERVQATVVSQLPNGRFAVLIKDQLLDLNLPRNTQPGEQMELTVAGKEPRLTFSLPSQTQAQLQQTAEPRLPPGVALSQTGKMLGELLTRPEGQARAATLQQSQPLFEGEPQPAQLAGQLATRLAESGLFYESHQAEWVSGERPLQTLLREPQAKLPPSDSQGSSRPLADAPRPSSLADLSGKGGADLLQPAVKEAEPSLARQTPAVDGARQEQSLRPEQAVRHLVQQQLELVENHPLVWQGQAWPGQPLRWKLELENERNPDSAEADATRVWQTRLDLALPKLGQVGVVASLRNGQFSLRFEAQDAETVKVLQQNQTLLADRFDTAGLALASTQVQRHVEETDF